MSLIAARLRDRGYDDLADAFDALTAENAALRKDAEWQDIETAPKDGTDILVMYFHIETQIVHNAFYMTPEEAARETHVGWWSYDKSEVRRVKLDGWMAPQFWMPLPETKQ